jgi:rare lipoprotein A
LRPRSMTRAATTAGALCLALTLAAAMPAAAQTESQGTANVAKVGIAQKRLHVQSGDRVRVTGTVRPHAAGIVARLKVWRKGKWRTYDRDRTGGRGRYHLRERVRAPMSGAARLVVGGRSRPLGRLNVYRHAYASWYGPGLYGNRLGCGGTLYPGRLGVAHKSLPCGTKVTLRHRGRSVRVKVIDRGPYVGGREYDLTEATAQRLRFRGHGSILTTR